ncbi:hypothetical protein GCM10010216_51470 [Streptomyces flaveolus]|nr:hypothetical protein GCM10010216_51470 [Streptomyces flaveolus]
MTGPGPVRKPRRGRLAANHPGQRTDGAARGQVGVDQQEERDQRGSEQSDREEHGGQHVSARLLAAHCREPA